VKNVFGTRLRGRTKKGINTEVIEKKREGEEKS
jgi:hypothetical protein